MKKKTSKSKKSCHDIVIRTCFCDAAKKKYWEKGQLTKMNRVEKKNIIHICMKAEMG